MCADQSSLDVKVQILGRLVDRGYVASDLCFSDPDWKHQSDVIGELARAIADRSIDRGILICSGFISASWRREPTVSHDSDRICLLSIRINAVSPGLIKTPIWMAFLRRSAKALFESNGVVQSFLDGTDVRSSRHYRKAGINECRNRLQW
jgi:hypothetical protein